MMQAARDRVQISFRGEDFTRLIVGIDAARDRDLYPKETEAAVDDLRYRLVQARTASSKRAQAAHIEAELNPVTEEAS